ncbi:MAG: SLBB domain-containing protein [Planctomycetes bacterium]|nr:SLBB domain-containing protein [Planctomycetota bacterium]
MRRLLVVILCLPCLAGCRVYRQQPAALLPSGPVPPGAPGREVSLLPPSRSLDSSPPPIEAALQFGPEPPKVSPPYRLKPGDVLEINIFGEDDALKQVTVGPDGRISYLSATDIRVADRTFEEVRRVLAAELSHDYIDPRVTITGSRYSGNTVTVTGVVRTPGRYEIQDGMKLLDVIAAAGGIASAAYSAGGGVTYDMRSIADLKRAVLLRGKQVVPVDFTALIDGRPQDIISNNVAVRAGDTVYIPSGASLENKVFVLGMVRYPQVVRFSGSISFVEAVAEAGGVPVGAWERRAFIVRGRLSSPTILPVNLRDVLTGSIPDLKLSPGDIVFVPKTPLKKLDEVVSQIVPVVSTLDTGLRVRDALR